MHVLKELVGTVATNIPDKYDTTIYTRQQLERAQVKGQVKGWAQGAVGMFLLMLFLKLFGWIPAILLTAIILFVGFKVFKAGKGS